jgi:tRNA (cmo5U34)-methyltransferase
MSSPWVFDAGVAATFDRHAQQHIPDYLSVIEDALVLTQAVCGTDAPILEIGCAVGKTLGKLHAAGFSNVTATDVSEAMLAKCNQAHGRLLLRSDFPAEYGPYRLVLANWTLHFLPPDQRLGFFADIYAGLEPGGYLMLTEKCVASPAMEDLYRSWKRSAGVTQREVEAKAAALEGVLFPMPANWVLSELQHLGFTVDIWRAAYGFVTFLAVKKENP